MESQYFLTLMTQILPILILLFIFFLAPIALVIWIVRYLRKMSEERRRLRLEVGKLAHEMEGLRNELSEISVASRKSTISDGGA